MIFHILPNGGLMVIYHGRKQKKHLKNKSKHGIPYQLWLGELRNIMVEVITTETRGRTYKICEDD